MIDFSPLKAKLLLEYPFFGTIASGMETVQNDNIESFATRENTIEYREAYIESLSNDERLFVLCNGALHEALSHTLRRGNRSPWLWAMACDYAINALLIDNGFTAPPQITYDKRFGTLSTEEIYAELALEFLDQEQNDRDSDDRRDGESADEKLSRAQRERRTHEAMEKDDPLSEAFARQFGLLSKSRIDWRNELRDCIGGHYISDYTLIPPSKKLLYEGIYLPGSSSRHLDLAIAIDSSGSVDEGLLSTFIAEVESIMETFGSYTIDLVVCDDRIRSHTRFENGESIEYTLNGGGGTDFIPVFELIESWMQRPKVLLYFTDLDGKFPPYEPPYEVLWIAPQLADVPFGRVIVLKDENG
ncbi:VWA-like domain-containing protein [uncultured Sulfuricurvum sp.]|uniref:vWA domain-containing protein n=1 Tax=uncultured Sulfuricurvum sp. TaxID=430693 RepID=UPI0026250ED9|nr:VWA-like domain-containing protein [uncultured Sulfuricurvum sp.]